MTTSPAKHVHHLTQEIGPRPPTSVAEARAAQYCFGVLEKAGLSPRMEPFVGVRSFSHIYAPPTVGLLLCGLLGTRRRLRKIPALMLGLASLSAIYGENTSRWRPLLSRVARGPSQNVVAVIPALGETRARLVLTAHVDSSRSGLVFSPSRAPGFRADTIRALWGGAAGIWSLLLPRPFRRVVSAISTAITSASLALILQRELMGSDVVGANDNASGVGVLLSAAQTIAKEPLERTELWIVLTGCEESDRVGMEALLDRHGKTLEEAWFLGLDTVAGPNTTLRWITSSGLLEEVRADYHLARIAEESAEGRSDLGAEPGIWRTAGLDTDSAAARGLRAMSIMALTSQGTLPNWHWPSDTFENLDEDQLQRCLEFTLDIVRRFDRRA